MDDIVGSIKEYWPWALGILGAAFIIPRLLGGQQQQASVPIQTINPDVLASQNAYNSQVLAAQAGVQIAQFENNTALGTAELQAIASGYDTLNQINNINTMGVIASYDAIKEISVGGTRAAVDAGVASYLSSAQTTASFADAVGQIGVGAGMIAQAAGNTIEKVNDTNQRAATDNLRIMTRVMGGYIGGY